MKTNFKIIAVLFWTLMVQSCIVEKEAVKAKTTQVETAANTQTSNQQTTDYTKTNQWVEDLYFEPINPLLTMEIVTQSGDTIKSKNTKISNSKTQTDTYNNKQQQLNTADQSNTSNQTDTVIKASEKKEAFDNTIILYIVGGVVVLGALLGVVALVLLYKTINKNAATIKTVADKLSL